IAARTVGDQFHPRKITLYILKETNFCLYKYQDKKMFYCSRYGQPCRREY
ncbi:hypothetical protein L9F63_011815, partial [Diploptera punctata]